MLRALPGLCCEPATFARRGAAWRQPVSRHWRTVFDGTQHRSFIHAIRVGHGGKSLLAAHTVDQPFLPACKDSVGKNGEIAEHPNQIYPLQKSRHYVARTNWRLYLHYTGRELLNQHCWAHLRNLKLARAIDGPHYCTARDVMGSLFSQKLTGARTSYSRGQL